MSKYSKIITIVILVNSSLLLGADVKTADEQLAPELKTKYIKGLRRYFNALEPWLEKGQVDKMVDSAIRSIIKKPDTSIAESYLRNIEFSFLSKKERKEKLKKLYLDKIPTTKIDSQKKERLITLISNDNIDVTEKDFSVFLSYQKEVSFTNLVFLDVLLLKSERPEDVIKFYKKLPEFRLKYFYYFSQSNLFHHFEKDKSYSEFYKKVLNDLIIAFGEKSDDYKKNIFSSVLRDIRITSGMDYLSEIEKVIFDQKTNDKSRYRLVYAIIQVYKKNSLEYVTRYFTDYCTDPKQLSYLTRALYWHGEKRDVDPVVIAKLKKLNNPKQIQAIKKEIPRIEKQ